MAFAHPCGTGALPRGGFSLQWGKTTAELLSVFAALQHRSVFLKTPQAALCRSWSSAGLFDTVKRGAFNMKQRHASEFRMTAFRCDVTGALPSKRFMSWKPAIQKPVRPQGPNGTTMGPMAQIRHEIILLGLAHRTVRAVLSHLTVRSQGHFYILP